MTTERLARRLAPLLVSLLIVAFAFACEAAKDASEKAAKNIEAAQSTEAKEMLRRIADGGLVYFQEEHASADGMTVTSRRFPAASGEICSAGGEGGKTEPSATNWSESPWTELRFGATSPHYYQYCYEVSADQKTMVGRAFGENDEWCIRVDGSSGSPVSGVIVEGGDSCPL